MDQDTFQLTVIALLTELVENTRPVKRAVRYGTNPSEAQIEDVVAEFLVDKPEGCMLQQIFSYLIGVGFAFQSVDPRKLLGTYLYRAKRRSNGKITTDGYRYKLRSNSGGMIMPTQKDADLKQG